MTITSSQTGDFGSVLFLLLQRSRFVQFARDPRLAVSPLSFRAWIRPDETFKRISYETLSRGFRLKPAAILSDSVCAINRGR